MYFTIIDCGTTNSRVYVLNDKFKIIKRGTKKVGVRDIAISGSKDVLKFLLLGHEMYQLVVLLIRKLLL